MCRAKQLMIFTAWSNRANVFHLRHIEILVECFRTDASISRREGGGLCRYHGQL